jgi:hypothetical protein
MHNRSLRTATAHGTRTGNEDVRARAEKKGRLVEALDTTRLIDGPTTVNGRTEVLNGCKGRKVGVPGAHLVRVHLRKIGRINL